MAGVAEEPNGRSQLFKSPSTLKIALDILSSAIRKGKMTETPVLVKRVNEQGIINNKKKIGAI
jgi:hypothetical protein